MESQTDSDAFQRAVDAIANKGQPGAKGEIYLPSGHYRLTRPIRIENCNFAMRGASHQHAILFFEECNGIQFESSVNQFTYAVQLESFAIVRIGQTDSFTGLSIRLPPNGGSTWKNCVTRQVTFCGSSSIQEYIDFSNNDQARGIGWDISMYVENCACSSASDLLIRGGRTGIVVAGDTSDFIISDCRFFAHPTAIKKQQGNEGLQVVNCFAIHVRCFVEMNKAVLKPGGSFCQVRGCHANHAQHAIYANQVPLLIVSDNLFISMDAHGSDIQLENCDRSIITNNILAVSSVNNHQGIVIVDTKHVVVSNNIITERDTGIWVRGTSDVDKAKLLQTNCFASNLNDVV